jgi:hypothetical protein
VPREGKSVLGTLVQNLTAADVARLDAFEGDVRFSTLAMLNIHRNMNEEMSKYRLESAKRLYQPRLIYGLIQKTGLLPKNGILKNFSDIKSDGGRVFKTKNSKSVIHLRLEGGMAGALRP